MPEGTNTARQRSVYGTLIIMVTIIHMCIIIPNLNYTQILLTLKLLLLSAIMFFLRMLNLCKHTAFKIKSHVL